MSMLERMTPEERPGGVAWRDPALQLVPLKARLTLQRKCERSRRWPLLMPALLICAMIALIGLSLISPYSSGVFAWIFVALCAMAIGVSSGKRRRRLIAMLHTELAHRPCWHCGYYLIGLTGPRCPECGTPFSPTEYEEIDAALSGDDEPESSGGQAP